MLHEDILKLQFVKFPDGRVVFIDKANRTGELVFDKTQGIAVAGPFQKKKKKKKNITHPKNLS